MGGNEYSNDVQYSMGVVNQLVERNIVNHMVYNNLALSYPALVTDELDPNVSSERTSAALYWPYEHPEHAGTIFEIIHLSAQASDAEVAEEVSRMRQLLLNASIGEAALERVPQGIRRNYERLKGGDEMRALTTTADYCRQLGTPWGACMLSRVAGRDPALAASRTAQLWHPISNRPRTTLWLIKGALQRTIEDEIT